uniref:Uncharacterized protein n=1 Tax=Cacopsylla melanoneura TaxID=428564 RepID=A0A8D9E978_9HEMI
MTGKLTDILNLVSRLKNQCQTISFSLSQATDELTEKLKLMLNLKPSVKDLKLMKKQSAQAHHSMQLLIYSHNSSTMSLSSIFVPNSPQSLTWVIASRYIATHIILRFLHKQRV